jgi:hypothetical protein
MNAFLYQVFLVIAFVQLFEIFVVKPFAGLYLVLSARDSRFPSWDPTKGAPLRKQGWRMILMPVQLLVLGVVVAGALELFK